MWHPERDQPDLIGYVEATYNVAVEERYPNAPIQLWAQDHTCDTCET